MSEKQSQEAHETDRRITIRWKGMLALSIISIALGLFVEWPSPQEASVPNTSSFLIILGGLLCAIGLLTALRRG
ncbi:MAG: hypothetical protein E8D40_03625 [Nitrospira sp.]|nr:MAG: hypothetical protein E8D40_03625 [Nitrospira sp.]